ncbi:hypothetical protein H7F51_01255 [Novosphingobium flavum]|uniref:Uncharacterized protein n=1 Tax=Novosphingobium flavum TaxID=1778672 RepID=A0A7X1KKC6_9SPHN|nr:hypothetical protein [Novosphingobium flavum]MBC2664138.1 hypothetical protein [Novosphingobium flavum]
MSVSGDFYQLQADLCAQAAERADLPMLRQKYEAAGAAWQALAQRETRIAETRANRLAVEAERKLAENGAPIEAVIS